MNKTPTHAAEILHNAIGFTVWTPDHGTLEIVRDVTYKHPRGVHLALGTSTEAELQAVMANYSYRMYFDSDGEYKGRDGHGIGIVFA